MRKMFGALPVVGGGIHDCEGCRWRAVGVA